MSRLSTIGVDADDTLWQSEQFFKLSEARFVELLEDYAGADHLKERLLEAEKRNLKFYGFGIKGFTLAMIETAIEVTGGKVPASTLQEILNAGREMGSHPIELLPHVQAGLKILGGAYRLVLITKGDLFDQERKLAQSGLGDLFHGIEIVSDKTVETYRTIFTRHGHGPGRAMMVGNSLRSDIVPALSAGSWAAFIPHALTWALEHANAPTDHPRFKQLGHFGEVADFVMSVKEK